MKDFLIYFAKDWLMIFGGLSIGLSVPTPSGSFTLLGSPQLDLVVFLPMGILMLAVSAYYKFHYKK